MMTRCCVEGRISSCFWTPNADCKYGWFTDCGDGTCVEDPTAVPEEVCGGGTYERCCEGGRLTTCYCPPGAASNYGLGLIDCGDG